ncbi:MAG: 2-amino-4-hydroxy-6-hydroxymethyldihydropteridine diphosphokinase [Pseudohongiella sp.]|nr:2-amino-4-hydroxy-6-hydroxymethyldihydropteridine diphosphokinase [Pseudohongiella sp.]
MTAPEISSIDDLFRHSPSLRTSALAVVALGANLPGAFGGPADMLRAAIPALQTLSESPVLVSGIVETEPEDCPPGSPRFANAVAVLKPRMDLTAVGFLVMLQKLETEFGRQRGGVRNAARVLDLDLISFGDQCIDTEFLTLPHPRARQRLFVMQPLASVWPAFRFPGDPATAAEHLLMLKAAI